MQMGYQSGNNKRNLVAFYSRGVHAKNLISVRTATETTTTAVKSSKHHVGPTLDPLKNRNIGLICLKMSLVAVWIPVWMSVKYLRIRININKMPAV